MTLSDKEWEQRVLCSDGSCIGVVGTDGRCKVCGLRYDGQLPSFAIEELPDDGGSRNQIGETTDPAIEPTDTESFSPDEAAVDKEWESRTLCIDESCIGIIGSDGRCTECGKSYAERSDE